METITVKYYAVTRPYCRPNVIGVFADDQQEAVDIANKAFGYCNNTSAVCVQENVTNHFIKGAIITP